MVQKFTQEILLDTNILRIVAGVKRAFTQGIFVLIKVVSRSFITGIELFVIQMVVGMNQVNVTTLSRLCHGLIE
jgi:hypothetical protein